MELTESPLILRISGRPVPLLTEPGLSNLERAEITEAATVLAGEARGSRLLIFEGTRQLEHTSDPLPKFEVSIPRAPGRGPGMVRLLAVQDGDTSFSLIASFVRCPDGALRRCFEWPEVSEKRAIEPIAGAPSVNLPWLESPFFAHELPRRAHTAVERELAEFYRAYGYVIVPELIAPQLARKIRADALALFDPNSEDGPRNKYRVQDGWQDSPEIRSLATSPRMLSLLEYLYGRRPIPFQTLNFERGTEQRAHSDTIHFNSKPRRYMCGVWVALEDVSADSGPLFVYPGSHLLPEYDYFELGIDLTLPLWSQYAQYEDKIEALMRAAGIERKPVILPQGHALIWAANLIHGGSRITGPGSRASQVTHYFFEDCLYYTPMISNSVTGELFVRELTDLTSLEKVPSKFNRHGISLLPSEGIRNRIHMPEQLPGTPIQFIDL